MDFDDLSAKVRAALSGAGAIREVRMFGGIGFMLDGNMVVAASRRGLLVRVGKERQRDALSRPGARPMIMRGRVMQDYVYVDAPAISAASVRTWVGLACGFVRTLPPKAAKRTKTGRANAAESE
jgi:TfoX/Sxy family transcriptional regulator of competence genes